MRKGFYSALFDNPIALILFVAAAIFLVMLLTGYFETGYNSIVNIGKSLQP